MSQLPMRCTNCGTTWFLELAAADRGDAAAVCPVCYLPVDPRAAAPLPMESIGDLEVRLDALVASARASGLESAAIVQVLRDELAFAAEMGRAGHRFSVQLIDLGPSEGSAVRRPAHDRREIPQNRGGHE